VAYHDLVISPAVVGDLTSNHATYRTPQGEVATSWTRSDRAVHLDVTVPANTTATVKVPLDRVGGASAQLDAGGLRPVSVDDHAATYRVGSGTWHFTAESN
jgi:alpha-L-rhamnosidase